MKPPLSFRIIPFSLSFFLLSYVCGEIENNGGSRKRGWDGRKDRDLPLSGFLLLSSETGIGRGAVLELGTLSLSYG